LFRSHQKAGACIVDSDFPIHCSEEAIKVLLSSSLRDNAIRFLIETQNTSFLARAHVYLASWVRPSHSHLYAGLSALFSIQVLFSSFSKAVSSSILSSVFARQCIACSLACCHLPDESLEMTRIFITGLTNSPFSWSIPAVGAAISETGFLGYPTEINSDVCNDNMGHTVPFAGRVWPLASMASSKNMSFAQHDFVI
jgi:hypothetical protein